VSKRLDDLPLRYATPPEWASAVLRRPLELLNDHAHLEKKAAANALELLNRWPEPTPPENWVAAMTAVARDEVEHLAVVTRLLARRGGRLTKQHSNPYAAELRSLVRMGTGRGELVDRLLVSALIEARSCERFRILADALVPSPLYSGERVRVTGRASDTDRSASDDPPLTPALSPEYGGEGVELAKLYRGLWASEHGHYLSFVQLAEQVDDPAAVSARWSEMLDAEAHIIRRQPPGPRMHSGLGDGDGAS
jgi:tRNA 2-(methylsulfanyl)-N6-isopentenyladenosine37 hydroxylase